MASTTPQTTATATAVDRLLAQMRAQRARWVELVPATEGGVPAKRVQILRPPETALIDFVVEVPGGVSLEVELRHVQEYVTGWDGITEADLIGPAGSSEPVPFAPELWREWVRDKNDWNRTIARALLDVITEHQTAKAADAKN